MLTVKQMKRVIRSQRYLKAVAEMMDDSTSGVIRMIFEEPDTAKAFLDILEYAKGCSFLELEK